jgi:CHAT domain-containing protein
VLTPGAGSASDDGFLTASEIADLELPADFVALSACNTANLEFTRVARDLPALSSAFAQAGAHATLGTLWPVNSETGAAVVADVFARLAGPTVGPADALAEAQRAYLAAAPSPARLHPRFWAPFIILGDGAAQPAGSAPRTPARAPPSRAAEPGSS